MTSGSVFAMQLVNGITLKNTCTGAVDAESKLHYGQRRYNQLLKERLEIFLHGFNAIELRHSRRVGIC
ncbi:MAG: hypothetical protein V8T87_08310 [Victivallales bacterium]